MTDVDPQTPAKSDGAPSLFAFDRSDLGVTAVLLGICAVLLWDTTRWPDVPPSLSQNTPPTLFPRLLLGITALLALALPFERTWKRRRGSELKIGGESRPGPVVFLTAALITLVVYLMPILGIFPVMVASTALMALLWGEKRYLAVGLMAVGLPIAVTALFAFGLGINLGFGLTGDLFR